MILIKLLILFAVIGFFLSRKTELCIVMSIAFATIHALFLTAPALIAGDLINGVKNIKVYSLFFIVSSIILLGKLMEKQGKINSMLAAMNTLFPDMRFLFALFPAFIGLLPMPGGAMFTAPVLEKVGDNLKMTQEKKVFFNYWFRHVWEYVWPLYPAFILMPGLVGAPVDKIIIAYSPYTAIALFSGITMLLMMVKKKHAEPSGMLPSQALYTLVRNIWPVLVIITVILSISKYSKFEEIHFVITLLCVNLFMILKSPWPVKEKTELLKKAFTPSMFLLILFIFLFKNAVETVHMASLLEKYVSEQGLSLSWLLFIIPFVSGMITGITYGVVAVSFPLCLQFFMLDNGSVDLTRVAFAYASGFSGVLLSPMHLCLVMTSAFFKADLKKVYYYLLFPVSLTFIYAVYSLNH